MKFWVLILAPTFLLITAPDIQAHNLITVGDNAQNHQHVYRSQEYGKPLQQGHLVQGSGGGGVILWGVGARSDYGKLNARRNGPIIDDQKPRQSTMPNSRKKYGSPVLSYGKPVQNK